VVRQTRYGKEGFEIHGQPEGKVMTVDFELEGAKFVALNGGPLFQFNESVSFQIHCETQDEIDYYWSKLTADGGRESQCGWLKDKFGLSWQVTPTGLIEILRGGDAVKAQRVTKAFLQMRKFDIAALKRAAEGK
jgi:predicted 3-demethylubiquinone-9 3-methyltransferase (glyoxalase superfamily)